MLNRILTLALISAAPSFAVGLLNYNLAPNSVQSIAGGTVFLQGTLTNTGDADIFLNDFSIQINPPGDSYLSADPNYFFDNVPGLLSPGQQYTGNIFELYVANNAPLGTFTGSGTIYGGVDVFASDSLGIQTFTVAVIAPEPAAAALFSLGLAVLWAGRRFLLNRQIHRIRR